MRTIIDLFAYAAKPLLDSLKKKGGIAVAEPEGFIVEGREGPLKEGELDRATQWARESVKNLIKPNPFIKYFYSPERIRTAVPGSKGPKD